ncbi:MAG: type II toxin-antitoxin system RelE family toxin [Phycisphaerales bacterium]
MVKIVVTPEADREIRATPEVIQGRIYGLLETLKLWPDVSGAKPLRGQLKGHFRKRTGDYRVIFRIDGDKLVVVKAGNRKDVYED